MHKSTKIPTDEASNTHVHPWIFYTYTYTHTHIDIYLFYDKKTDDASLMHHNAAYISLLKNTHTHTHIMPR